MSLFISHSDHSEVDRKFIDKLEDTLRNIKPKMDKSDFFVDHKNIPGSADWFKEIETHLLNQRNALFLVTSSFLRSKWLIYEYGYFLGTYKGDVKIQDKFLLVTLSTIDVTNLITPLQTKQFVRIDKTEGLTDFVKFLVAAVGIGDDIKPREAKIELYNSIIDSTEYRDLIAVCHANQEFNPNFEQVDNALRKLFGLRDFEIIAQLDSIKRQGALFRFIMYLIEHESDRYDVLSAVISSLGNDTNEYIEMLSKEALAAVRNNKQVIRRGVFNIRGEDIKWT